MQKQNLIYLVLVACTITSCSVFKPKKSKIDTSNAQNVEIQRPQEPVVELEKPTFVTTPEITEVAPRQEQSASVPLSTFTAAELEHIKSSSYDPFPEGSNRFSVNLNEAKSNFTYPLDNGKFSSGYGYRGRSFHSGADILESAGAPVYAVFDGVVRLAKPYYGYGNVIVVRHNNGLETVYSHNQRNLVRAGDIVKSGEKIALVGRTGTATTNHLHFEVRIKGITINPILLLDVHNNTIQDGILTVERNGSSVKASNTNKSVGVATAPQQPTVKELEQTKQEPSKNQQSTTVVSSTTAGSQYHTIVKGDTLYGLALRYKTSVANLCRLNSIGEKTILSLGKKLRIK